jgi:small neutral amino acid transporter SnatA (MarC family)
VAAPARGIRHAVRHSRSGRRLAGLRCADRNLYAGATALLAIFVSFWVLAFFIVAGELLLRAMGIPLRSLQIAGGIVLFLYGVGMVLGEPKDNPAPATSDDVLALAI